MARGRLRGGKDVPTGRRTGGALLGNTNNGIRLKGSSTKAAAERVEYARQAAAKFKARKTQRKQLLKDLDARKAAAEQEALKASSRAAAMKAAEQEAKRQAEAVAKRQAKAAELKAAHDNYISTRRNDAIIFADEAGIPAREFLESADDSAIEFWALSTRPKPGGFESARLEQLRKEIDPQNLEKLDFLVGRYKEAAKKRTGAGGAPEGTDRFDPTAKDAIRNELERIDAARANRATPEPPVIDTKAWGDALRRTVDSGKATGSFLWKWGIKKPIGLAARYPRRAVATAVGAVGGLAGLSYYLGSKRNAETAQEVANIEAKAEDARREFDDYITSDDIGFSYGEGGATLPWINNIRSDSSAEGAAKALADEIERIQKQLGERYKGFSSGGVDEETLQKVKDLWTVYNTAGERTNSRRWRNIKEELSRYRPEHYAVLTGDLEKQAKIFHDIDAAVRARASQAQGGK